MIDPEIEELIKEYFEQNYELLRLEGGHAMTDDVKQAAYQQVLLYYKKLQHIAEKVTETEVKLTLPDKTTPKGRKFNIEGIVDIVKEDSDTWMYDIKTHDADYVAGNIENYEKQLNVYAHIYQELRGNQLDHTAVIATSIPASLREAITGPDPKRFDFELGRWNPVIEIPADKKKVKATIDDFASIVDKIEGNDFEPASMETLKSKVPGANSIFAVNVCRNCDARYSCESYRTYAQQGGPRSPGAYKKYFEDFGPELQQQEFIAANLSVEKTNQEPEIPQ